VKVAAKVLMDLNKNGRSQRFSRTLQKPDINIEMNDALLNLKVNSSDKLQDFQKYIVNDWEDHRFNVLINARQIGASTMIAYSAIINSIEGKLCGIVVGKESTVRIYRDIINNILKINNVSGLITRNDNNAIDLITGGHIGYHVADNHTKSLRGRAFNRLYLTDYDFLNLNNREEFRCYVGSIISSTKQGKIVYQSTPRTSDGVTYLSKLPDHHTNIVNYNVVTSRDENWTTQMKTVIGSKVFNEEFNMTKYYHLL